ncbi:hypothetical protein QL285_075539 [Trifolium repens]|nr:hypothetical protein QL285_075539 [Trifolium repens]
MIVKHVNRIRIGRRVIVRNSDNRNTNRKILPKWSIIDRRRIVIQNRRIVTSKIISDRGREFGFIVRDGGKCLFTWRENFLSTSKKEWGKLLHVNGI